MVATAICNEGCEVNHPLDVGRVNILRKLSNNKYGVNIGCGLTHFPNKINLDNTFTKAHPNIIADVLHLPFKDGVFGEVVFADCVEHLPIFSEHQAFSEIERVLNPEGRVIVSTPNDTLIAKLLDPFYWFSGHRHYNGKTLSSLLPPQLKIKLLFVAGKIPFGVATFPYILNWLFRRRQMDLFSKIVNKAYNGAIHPRLGGTLYMLAEKNV